MRVSVVVRTRSEADRLRLTLASLPAAGADEVVVVDDGSCDGTEAVLGSPPACLPCLRVVRHPLGRSRGRSGAANAGAEAATGDVLLFLDGDTLAGPGLATAHRAVHAAAPGRIGRGEIFHLRGTRRLLDPAVPTPRPEHAAWFACLPDAERARLAVTTAQVVADFPGIERRAAPGVYPGAAPRLLETLERQALRGTPGCGVLWAAASGSNLSVPRAAFLKAGGFDERLDINEHRELALRLWAEQGARMVPADGARTYHLTHRSGWRDPLADGTWEEIVAARHPIAAVRLLPVFWSSVSDLAGGTPSLPEGCRIESLPALEAAASDGALRPEHERARLLLRRSASA